MTTKENFIAPSYLTIRQFCSKYSWPTESGLRAIIQNSSENGFGAAIKRYRRRVLLDEKKFFEVLDQNQ